MTRCKSLYVLQLSPPGRSNLSKWFIFLFRKRPKSMINCLTEKQTYKLAHSFMHSHNGDSFFFQLSFLQLCCFYPGLCLTSLSNITIKYAALLLSRLVMFVIGHMLQIQPLSCELVHRYFGKHWVNLSS